MDDFPIYPLGIPAIGYQGNPDERERGTEDVGRVTLNAGMPYLTALGQAEKTPHAYEMRWDSFSTQWMARCISSVPLRSCSLSLMWAR